MTDTELRDMYATTQEYWEYIGYDHGYCALQGVVESFDPDCDDERQLVLQAHSRVAADMKSVNWSPMWEQVKTDCCVLEFARGVTRGAREYLAELQSESHN